MNKSVLFAFIFLTSILIVSCSSANLLEEDNGRLQVVATTTFVGETVSRIADDLVDLTVLLAPGQNPHGYTPRPQDITRVAQADVVFANGADLEEFLDELITSAGGAAEIVYVSEGINYMEPSGGHLHEDDEDEQDGDHEGVDPHVWFDPNNVIHWTENIDSTLSRLDPENADTYQENARAYRDELTELDSWISQQVEQIPEGERKLVTDHISFVYFADAYGFEQVGAVIQAPTTEAETSGQDLAHLSETILVEDVKAIFVSVDADQSLAERIAEDTGVKLVRLYFGSLSSDGPAETYVDFMRYNVSSIVEALK